MDRSLRLAALASAAVPGLDPMSVQEVVGGADEHFDVAFVQDTQQRRWVIRAPRSEVAAAHMDASLALLALLVRRVPFAVPAAKGFAPIPKIGRAAVHAYIPGHPLDLAALHPGHPVTAELGRTIALIHNVDRALYDEAGLASYDAESYRRRHLAEIDRGAATGRVPSGLLARWEEALDDVRLWRFAPTPVHGALTGSDILVTFPDRADAARATIRGITGWESAKVADPADDFAALVAEARPEVVDAVLAAYGHVRVERPDEHLLARARLVSELGLLAMLLRAVGARDEIATEATTARLRRLDDTVHSEALGRRLRIVPAPPVSGSGPAPRTAEAAAPGTVSPDEVPRATPSQAPEESDTEDAAGVAPVRSSATADDASDEDPTDRDTTDRDTTDRDATDRDPTDQDATDVIDVVDVAGDTASECTASEDTASEDTDPEGTASEGTASEGTAPEDTDPEDTAPQDTDPEDIAPQDTRPEDTMSEDTMSEDTQPEDTMSEDDGQRSGEGTGPDEEPETPAPSRN